MVIAGYGDATSGPAAVTDATVQPAARARAPASAGDSSDAVGLAPSKRSASGGPSVLRGSYTRLNGVADDLARYRVSFPMFSKSHFSGPEANAL